MNKSTIPIHSFSKIKVNLVMQETNKTRIFGFSILFVFAVVFVVLGYQLVFFEPPFGFHFMRQTDSLSFVAQYYNRGFHFFEPALFNLRNEDAKAACEFPLYYYLTSLLYLIFGKVPAILKILNILTVYTGVYFSIKLAKQELSNRIILPILIGCFFFTSTVVNDYSFNYLPDSSAFGLVLIGIYFMYSFMMNGFNKHANLGLIFFTLSGLIKVTYCIYPIAFLVLAILIRLFYTRFTIAKSTLNKIIIFSITCLLLVGLWNSYILYYNNIHHSTSFLTEAVPIWEFSSDQITQVWEAMIHYWGSSYLAYPSMIVLMILLIFQIVFFRHSNKILALLILITTIGALSYFLLFFIQFRDHDYYALVFYPWLFLILLNGWITFSNSNLSKIKLLSYSALFLFLIVIGYGIRYSRLQLNDRRQIIDQEMAQMALQINQSLSEINQIITKKNARIIVGSDHSQNGSFYFLNREGWNVPNENDINKEKMQLFINEGADYLIVSKEFNVNPIIEYLNDIKIIMDLQIIQLKQKRAMN